MKVVEHQEQSAFFHWVKINERIYPELRCCFAIPNGGHRHIAVAVKLKAEGVKSGIPDIFFAAAKGKYHGLFLEMKAGKNKPTRQQQDMMQMLWKQGYMCAVAYGWEQARDITMDYLKKEE